MVYYRKRGDGETQCLCIARGTRAHVWSTTGRDEMERPNACVLLEELGHMSGLLQEEMRWRDPMLVYC